MSAILTRFFEHNHWANLTLLDICVRLSPAQLAQDAPQTVGTIHQTLYHIAVNEARYLTVFDGEIDGETNGGIGSAQAGLPDLTLIRQQLDRTGKRLIELAGLLDGDPVYETQWQGQTVHVPASLPLLQAVNHGTEHRAQVVNVLRDLGIEPPHLDAWAYGAAQAQ